jgi:hypothetical protein
VRLAAAVPPVLGLCASAIVVALSYGSGAQHERPDAADDYSVPRELAGYSYLTGRVSDSPPGPVVALFQHGYGVEFLDYPQAVVLGAGGDVYRRVDAAEDRAGGETQGDPAPMLLSPDGTRVAVGDHDTDDPDVVVIDLMTGEVSTHPLPQGRSVVSAAWSNDGQSLAILLSPEPTNPYSGGRITGDIGLLDLTTDETEMLDEGTATAAAFSPDGTELAVERSDDGDTTLSVIDLASGSRRKVPADGLLAGAAAWSPDGRLLAITTVKPAGAPAEVDDPGIPSGLSFVDATGGGGTTPEPMSLDLFGPGRVLGWAGPDEVVTLLNQAGADPFVGPDHLTLTGLPLDGSQPRTLMRVPGIQSYGVGRFQLASAAADRLQVVDPDGVDRGPWPMSWRVVLAVLAGLAVWLVAWIVARVVLRFRGPRPRSA